MRGSSRVRNECVLVGRSHEEGRRTRWGGDKNRRRTQTSVSKIVSQAQFVVNVNATELPNYSKTLHFDGSRALFRGFCYREQKANKLGATSCFCPGFAVGVAGHAGFHRSRLRFLPDLWPLRCSQLGTNGDEEV